MVLGFLFGSRHGDGAAAAPSTPTFAVAAERLRRAGRFDEAAALCRDGLARCPHYLSARVTLGCALIELRAYDEARAELKAVLKVAPDNFAAMRALANLHDLSAGDVRDDESWDPAEFEQFETSVPEAGVPAAAESRPPVMHAESRIELPAFEIEDVIAAAPPDAPTDAPLEARQETARQLEALERFLGRLDSSRIEVMA
jgi:tetratricopeptide (TPR) repeat protein